MERVVAEEGRRERRERRLEAAELLREEEQPPRLAARRDAGERLEPAGGEAGADAVHRLADHRRRLAGRARAGPAEDLVLARRRQAAEELHEPVHEVALADDDVDREAEAELFLGEVDHVADLPRLLAQLRLVEPDEVFARHDDDEAVERTRAAVLAEHPEQLDPDPPFVRPRPFGDPLPRRVEEDQLVGEEPITRVGAADPLHPVLAHRELQAGVLDRDRLPRLRAPDDEKPRHGVDRVAAAPGAPQQVERLGHVLAQPRQLLLVHARRVGEPLQQLPFELPRADLPRDRDADDHQHGDDERRDRDPERREAGGEDAEEDQERADRLRHEADAERPDRGAQAEQDRRDEQGEEQHRHAGGPDERDHRGIHLGDVGKRREEREAGHHALPSPARNAADDCWTSGRTAFSASAETPPAWKKRTSQIRRQRASAPKPA